MQIHPKNDRLIFISEELCLNEKDKVQSFLWEDIMVIQFLFPEENIWRTIMNFFVSGIAFFFASADTTALFQKEITVLIKLKNGEVVEKQFHIGSIKEGRNLERKLLHYLNAANP